MNDHKTLIVNNLCAIDFRYGFRPVFAVPRSTTLYGRTGTSTGVRGGARSRRCVAVRMDPLRLIQIILGNPQARRKRKCIDRTGTPIVKVL
jgi:hypothetical protein